MPATRSTDPADRLSRHGSIRFDSTRLVQDKTIKMPSIFESKRENDGKKQHPGIVQNFSK